MVKLRKANNEFTLTVPLDKIKRKGWSGSEEFDVEFDADGNLRYVELK